MEISPLKCLNIPEHPLIRRVEATRSMRSSYSRGWWRRNLVKPVGRGGELWLEVQVMHILHEGFPRHMLDEGHDEGVICTCSRWSDRGVPNLLENVIEDIEWLLLLDSINQIPLIGLDGGCITNPQSQRHPQHPMQSDDIGGNIVDGHRVMSSAQQIHVLHLRGYQGVAIMKVPIMLEVSLKVKVLGKHLGVGVVPHPIGHLVYLN
jgi:hypothetical protein